ncbi:GNAT family N-acetyltransferase [Sinorhizobium medicae]|nr:GNAT family N-acetyltransferase [Sinorhizobium medicae]
MVYDSMDFDCVFRSAAPSDYEELRRFIETGWIELYSPHVSARSVERFVREDGAGQHLDLYLETFELALVDGSIVGSISLCDDCITALFVEKRYRGNGIGSCLLHNAEISSGHYLEVAAFNTHAISFYERRGWLRRCTFNEDAFGTNILSVFMTKRKGTFNTANAD